MLWGFGFAFIGAISRVVQIWRFPGTKSRCLFTAAIGISMRGADEHPDRNRGKTTGSPSSQRMWLAMNTLELLWLHSAGALSLSGNARR